MPELPEVEAARRAAAVAALGRRIVAVEVADDPLVLDGAAPGRLRRALLGRRVRAAARHGKYLWLALDRRPWLLVHFGMTGGLHASGTPGVRLVSGGRRGAGEAWPPRFTKLRLTFDDGGELAIADARRLGRIRLRRDPPREPPVASLGFDALRAVPSPRALRALLAGRTAPIKAVLLDQTVLAGVGNWLADEVLHGAGIAPGRRAASLSLAEVQRLQARLRAVVRTAVRLRADSDRYPADWLFHRRWDRRPGVTVRGDAIRWDTIGGRTTAWVPAVQH